MKDKVETEVTKLSLDEALCVTSLGLKELTEGQGVKVEGLCTVYTRWRETCISANSYFQGQFQVSTCPFSVISPLQVWKGLLTQNISSH